MKKRKLNTVIAFIIGSDFLITVSASLLSPIFALFVTGQITNGSASVVGYAIAIYWITKSALQLPIARFIDKNHGEVDDYYFMISGVILGGTIMAGYYFAYQTWHVFALQFMLGVADAMLVPPFYAVFTRHIDKGSEGMEWSLRSSLSLGGGAGLGSALGGVLLATVGFRNIFLLAAAIYFLSAGVMFFLRPYIKPKAPRPVKRIFAEHHRH